jgi:hypothetical protein
MQNPFQAIAKPTPKSEAPSAIAARIATSIEQHALLTFRTHVQQLNNGMLAFWRNQEATPQQIAAALDTKASALFAEHAAAAAALVARHPYLVLVPVDQMAEDGAHQVLIPPAWAEIVPEIDEKSGQPTGRVTIAEKPSH